MRTIEEKNSGGRRIYWPEWRRLPPVEKKIELPDLRRPEEFDAVLRFHCPSGWDGLSRVWRSSTPWG